MRGGGGAAPIGQRNSVSVSAKSSTHFQKQGSLRQTGADFDLAIDGKGFFLVKKGAPAGNFSELNRSATEESSAASGASSGTGESSGLSGSTPGAGSAAIDLSSASRSETPLGCLRTGSFHVDENGVLVNDQGLALQGWKCPETGSSEIQPTLENAEDVRMPEEVTEVTEEISEEVPPEAPPTIFPIFKKIAGSPPGEYKMKLDATYCSNEHDWMYNFTSWNLECSDETSRSIRMKWCHSDSTSNRMVYFSFSTSSYVAPIIDPDTGVITDFGGRTEGAPLPSGFSYDKTTNKLTYQIPGVDDATITIDFSDVRIREREENIYEDLADKTVSFKEPIYCEKGYDALIKNLFGRDDTEKSIGLSLSDNNKIVFVNDIETDKGFRAALILDEDGNVTGYKIRSNTSDGFIADGKLKDPSSYSANEPISLYTTPGSGADTFTLDLSGMRIIFADRMEVEIEGEIEEESEAGVEETAAGGAGSPISFSISDGGILTASFEDGSVRPLYQLALVNCPAPDRMKEESGGLYLPTADSGDLRVGTSGAHGFGIVVSGCLEDSTTDVAKELAGAIKTQYAYAANTKIIGSIAEMLDTLMRL